jgi:hypothetical protein
MVLLDELETIRNSGWLINEANLVFMLMQVQWEVLKSQPNLRV